MTQPSEKFEPSHSDSTSEPSENPLSSEPQPVLDRPTRRRLGVLLGSILLVALCSITYELIIGTVSSYLLGNSVYQFSLTIGLYLSAMGLGSYLSKFVRQNLLDTFIWVELFIGILGGTCSAFLFGVFTFTPYFQPVMWLVTLAIGTLVGLEIPLLTRYMHRFAQLRVALASVLSWDYIGALVGSIAFPLLLLPVLGLLNSAAVIGLVNIGVAAIGLFVFRHEVRRLKLLAGACVLAAIALVALFFTSDAYERFLDKRLFQDPVIYREQTPYQKLTLTAWRNDYRLFINGAIQFSSIDEYRYHEALVHPAVAAVKASGVECRKVLILGGGDGLVVRQLKLYPEIEQIDLVDLDPRMTALAKAHPVFRRLNEDAFYDPRLKVINDDAMQYLQGSSEVYDAIFVDLPDPNNESLAKLYSVSFYRLVRQHLHPEGAVAIQSTGAYFSPNAFWSIHRTIEAAFCPNRRCSAEDDSYVIPYHVWIPSFGDWGFNLASARPLSPEAWQFDTPPRRYLTEDAFAQALYFPPDIAERDVEVSRLIEPLILEYYLRDWRQYHQ